MKIWDRKTIIILGWLLIWTTAVLIRVLYPTADPPRDLSWSGGYFADEGFWTHDARFYTKFNAYPPDDWHNRFVSPPMHYLVLGVFKLLGAGFIQTRVVAQFLALFTLALFIILLRHYSWAWIAWIMMSWSFVLIAYQRIAILENAALFTGVICLFAVQKALRDQKPYLYFLCGIFAMLAYITKGTQLYLVVAIFIILTASNKVPCTRTKLSLFILGFSGVLLPWLICNVVPNWTAISRYNQYYASQQDYSMFTIVKNICTQPEFFYFNRFPWIFLTAWWMLVLWPKIRANPLLGKISGFVYLWFLLGLIFFMPMGYRPLRYYIPLCIPMFILSAMFTGIIVLSNDLDRIWKQHVNGFKLFQIAWLLIPVLANLIFLTDQFWDGKFSGFGRLPGFSNMDTLLFIITGLLFITALLNRKIRRTHMMLILFVVCMGLQAGRSVTGLMNREYSVFNSARELAAILPPDSVVMGQWAPELCLESDFTAIPMWKGFVNDKNPFQRFGVTHVLSWEYPLGNELELQRLWFPTEMGSVKQIKQFTIKGTSVILWEVQKNR